MTDPRRATLCIVQPAPSGPSETFLRAHAEYMPVPVAVIAGDPTIDGRSLLRPPLAVRARRRLVRALSRSQETWQERHAAAFARAFRHHGASAVLAEYGTTAVDVMDACRLAGLPLVVQFHGYDAYRRTILERAGRRYPELFRDASAIVGVSRAMCRQLVALGAPEQKVHWNPCGADVERFGGADPASAPPVFVAVGRFCEKKGPDLTLRAFAEVRRRRPDARLRMVGFGPLLEPCAGLARELGVADAVTFLGACPPAVVREEMRRARCFVQHSVVAADGDSEGTPVAILEAGASGLPVVSTRHAGIPDVVLEGRTGLLVEERDVAGMAERMLQMAEDPGLAAAIGRAARDRVRAEFSIGRRVGILWEIIESCIEGVAGGPRPRRPRQEAP